MRKSLVHDPPIAWPEIMCMGVSDWRNKTLKANVCKLVWSAAVYHLWRQRNDIRHGNPPKAQEKVLQEVVWDVNNRIRGKGKFKKIDVNVEICRKIGV